jgi:origin recognition complex subunit 3
MPDICIVYKLHLECGRLINMYDWLQAFLAIVNPSELGEEQRDVAPEIQYPFEVQ